MVNRIVEELREIESKREDAETRKVLIEAELAGLEENRRALQLVIQRQESGSARKFSVSSGLKPIDIAKLKLVDAVVAVIDESPEPMRVDDVERRFRELGRSQDVPSVNMTLAYAHNTGRIRRVSRGVYGRIDQKN